MTCENITWDKAYRTISIGKNKLRIVCMLRPTSYFAHTIFEGTNKEVIDFIIDLELAGIKFSSY